ISIERFLNGEGIDAPRYEDELLPVTPIDDRIIKNAAKAPRAKNGSIPVESRKSSFAEVEKAFTPEQAVAEAKRCLSCGPCSDCRMCELACQQKAVDFSQRETEIKLEVGAVVLAPGFRTFDATLLTQYGYGVYDNVYTSIEFERVLSASGPTMGHIVRRSDRSEPRNVAFIQCVGSRDATVGNDYCSAVCCMYTAKEAVIAKEHLPALDCSVFYIDERAHGKNFDRYYENAKKNNEVEYIRGSISGIKEFQKSKNLLLTFVGDDGKQQSREFDMVVLAVGLKPCSESRELAGKFGIELNKYDFCETDILNPVRTTRDGVYVAGAFQSPKDIPDSVTQASSAACEVMIKLAAERGTRITPLEYPPEREVGGEPPRIGVMVCRCGFNIGAVVDVPAVVEFAKTLPGVAFAEESLYTCSQDNLERITQVINENKLNRFVIASCTVRTHLPLFEQTMKLSGLNKYLFEMANVREQDAWVHKDVPGEATEKAKDLVAGAVARVARHSALQSYRTEVLPAALVIGGGPSGMTAALSLADQGVDVYLVEKEDRLGGNLLNMRYTLEGADIPGLLSEMVSAVEANQRIKLLKKHSIREISG
ncbi:MAG TPA: FAD-dependent oxidoreductase, partial [bacterium]|nr:FAD-dependent oxidoreductase [bacterium]